MSDHLTIDFKWMGGFATSAFDKAFAAEIGLQLGGQWLTELEELESRTTMTHLRGCAHTLARWLAGNWWRIRWEPETKSARSDPDWRMAHSLANAGGGFAWPNVFFASDGESVAVASFPRLKADPHEPLRYLNSAHGRISAAEFEQKIDTFIRAVVSRHDALRITGDDLPRLWGEVVAERQDPNASRWRRIEALCGFDPDEAPASLIEMLILDRSGFGARALEEVAAQARDQTESVLSAIEGLAGAKGRPGLRGFSCRPEVMKTSPALSENARPWERAAVLAKAARKEWGLADGPISDSDLSDLLQISKSAFSDRSEQASIPFPVALRTQSSRASLYFTHSRRTSRRFTASRLLGHWLDRSGNTDRLIPATDVKTADQQFQRAFAQEFLCPYNSLMDRFPTAPPSPDEIEDAAAHFDVSPLVVRTLLVNRGEMDRESLTWTQ
jgi:Zn-dependent peptidase ImmA (M78 family)